MITHMVSLVLMNISYFLIASYFRKISVAGLSLVELYTFSARHYLSEKEYIYVFILYIFL